MEEIVGCARVTATRSENSFMITSGLCSHAQPLLALWSGLSSSVGWKDPYSGGCFLGSLLFRPG